MCDNFTRISVQGSFSVKCRNSKKKKNSIVLEEFRQGCYLVKDSYPMRFVGEFTVKTLGPGVLNEDQKSRDSIKNEEFTEDSLQ